MQEYTPKPFGYKTEAQWLKEGMVPQNGSVYEEYAAVNKKGEVWLDNEGNPKICRYISPENVIPVEIAKMVDLSDLKDKKIVCFDTETTGFSQWDEIVQITIADKDGELLNTFVKPVKKKKWDKASDINHIYPETVKDAPTAKELREAVKSIFNSADIIVGHNIAFDIRMVRQCFHISLDNKPVFDTLEFFREDYPHGSHKLRDAICYYCPDKLAAYDADAHKADTDVKATLAVFEAIVLKKEREAEVQEIEFE